MISELIILMSVLSSRVEQESWRDWIQDTKEGKMVIFNNIFRITLPRARTQTNKKLHSCSIENLSKNCKNLEARFF